MLTLEAKAALEQFRKHKSGEVQLHGDDYWKVIFALTDELLRLYPPGWGEPITPENLGKCGFVY